ncbi:MAG: 2-succinyl-5-enolpyruvyl-6-hydroxy-3-cyclohexene-1-carboxylic-acid synthase [Armatimonadota bacterium]
MTPQNALYVYIGAFVDDLARCGVRHLCLCPGSRSTPLAITAARHPTIKVWTLIDERSTAFFALGMAKTLRAPVAVLSTSGTAAANFLPAVVEARYGRVPLVVLTADRPHELRESAALQTIDQNRLYGAHAKWFMDVALPEATDLMLRYVRTLAGQAVAVACEAPAGAVHLNFPLREPLVPVLSIDEMPDGEGRAASAWEGREGGRPYAAAYRSQRALSPDLLDGLAGDLARLQRGLIVCGPSDDPGLPRTMVDLATALEYPVLADPLSQVRCGPHDRRLVIDSYDPLLRVNQLARRLAPEVILRFGGVPASRPLMTYMQLHPGARQIVVDVGGWTDPTRLAGEFIQADPILFCEALLAALHSRGERIRVAHAGAESAWASLWRRLGLDARNAFRRRLENVLEPFEGKVFSELSGLLPDGSILYIGNSMPVRDLDSFFPGTSRAIRFLGNRGASGIDGLTSSALGAAAADAGPVVAVLGDLAFYHDMNGLLAAKLHRLHATIVLINNDGGGIFSFLPQAAYPEHFEALFGTPHGLEFRHAAEMYGATFSRAGTWDAFRTQVQHGLASDGLSIIEVRTGRTRNVALHQEMWAEVQVALGAELAAPGKAP